MTRAKAGRSMPRACRVCGCTDDWPCITDEGPCHWTDEHRDLCSACAAALGGEHVVSMTLEGAKGDEVASCSCGGFRRRVAKTGEIGRYRPPIEITALDVAIRLHWIDVVMARRREEALADG